MFRKYRLNNHHLQSLTFKGLNKICKRHDIEIGDKDLKIILRIMQDNPFTVLNETYNPILFIEITRQTSKTVCNLFKPIVTEHYLINEI